MNNYANFPKLRNNGISMKFGDYRYSGCTNSRTNRKYLLERDYINGSLEFYVFENNRAYTSKEEFIEYLTKSQEEPGKEICSLCGGTLILRANKNSSGYFFGCKNYPACKFIKKA
ncbi:MAG: topoisomerase DNA-binding C4 zinc finger domain-containing protein [Bacilli bacterium]|nr:topoisomerase DNA-binding C4 zinc finger domain-containing protein [Bacilli bacterium]